MSSHHCYLFDRQARYAQGQRSKLKAADAGLRLYSSSPGTEYLSSRKSN